MIGTSILDKAYFDETGQARGFSKQVEGAEPVKTVQTTITVPEFSDFSPEFDILSRSN